MALPHNSSDDERALQDGLNRSWRGARRCMADPQARARIQAQRAKLTARQEVQPMTSEEFLAWAAELSAGRRRCAGGVRL